MLDEQVRANPEAPFNYDDYAEMYGPLIAQQSGSVRNAGALAAALPQVAGWTCRPGRPGR